MSLTTLEEKRTLNLNHLAVSIPWELLVEIFIRLIEGETASSNIYVPPTKLLAVRKMRFAICQVCRTWREIAFATKRIWAVISFPHNVRSFKPKTRASYLEQRRPPETTSGTFDILREDLERAGDSPLSLYLYSGGKPWDAGTVSSSMAGEISRIAKRLLHRCRHIQFDDDFIQVSRIFELSSPLPKLHSIFASVHRTADFCRTNDFDLTLAPQLRDLRLYTVDWIPPLREGPIILKFGTDLQLKRVDLGGDNIDYNSINVMLAACPQLEELQWEDFTVQETGRNPSPLPPMESLRHVILWGALPISIVGSLNALQLVRLELHYPDDIWGHQPFPLSDPSQLPMLRALILEGDRVATHSQEAKIAKFVEKHPHLEIVGLSMYLTEVMAQTLASIPTLRHARVLRHVGDDNGARLLVRTWAERNQGNAHPASPSEARPVLYMVREIVGNNVENGDDNDGSFDDCFSFRDWKFTAWSNADWDLFFAPQ